MVQLLQFLAVAVILKISAIVAGILAERAIVKVAAVNGFILL